MASKQYAPAENYESKLEKVMARLGIKDYNYNWDRFSCWVEFTYRGQLYRFSHGLENAKAHGQTVRYGSDVFAQVVLALEDLARMVDHKTIVPFIADEFIWSNNHWFIMETHGEGDFPDDDCYHTRAAAEQALKGDPHAEGGHRKTAPKRGG